MELLYLSAKTVKSFFDFAQVIVVGFRLDKLDKRLKIAEPPSVAASRIYTLPPR